MVIHRFPSLPVAMPTGSSLDGRRYSVIAPSVVMRPTAPRLGCPSANHRAPSGPTVMSWGPLFAVGRANSVKTPDVVTRPIFDAAVSTNHMFPSGPATMRSAPLSGVGIGYMLKCPAAVAGEAAPTTMAARPTNIAVRDSFWGFTGIYLLGSQTDSQPDPRLDPSVCPGLPAKPQGEVLARAIIGAGPGRPSFRVASSPQGGAQGG